MKDDRDSTIGIRYPIPYGPKEFLEDHRNSSVPKRSRYFKTPLANLKLDTYHNHKKHPQQFNLPSTLSDSRDKQPEIAKSEPGIPASSLREGSAAGAVAFKCVYVQEPCTYLDYYNHCLPIAHTCPLAKAMHVKTGLHSKMHGSQQGLLARYMYI